LSDVNMFDRYIHLLKYNSYLEGKFKAGVGKQFYTRSSVWTTG